MKHHFIYDTSDMRLSDASEHSIAVFHAWRSNRFHRTLFPVLLAVACITIAWAAGVI